MLAEQLVKDPTAFAAGWNFGPAEDDAKPVKWIADKLVDSWGDGAKWITDSAEHPHEANLLKLDVSKAKSYLKWRPLLPLDSALEWIVTWYRSFQEHADLGSLTRAQIKKYESLS